MALDKSALLELTEALTSADESQLMQRWSEFLRTCTTADWARPSW